MNDLPVFFHVPKCAGTYIATKILAILSNAYNQQIKKITVFAEDNEQFAYYSVFTRDEIDSSKTTKINNTYYKITSKDIDHVLDYNIDFCIVHSRGFKTHRILTSILRDKYKLHQYISIRDPLDRLVSVYYYLNNNMSLKETTHGAYNQFDNVFKFLQSKTGGIEFNWINIHLMNLPTRSNITPKNVYDCYEYLNTINMNIKDSSQAETTIKEILSVKNIEHILDYPNQNINPNINLDKPSFDLSKAKKEQQKNILANLLHEYLLYYMMLNTQ